MKRNILDNTIGACHHVECTHFLFGDLCLIRGVVRVVVVVANDRNEVEMSLVVAADDDDDRDQDGLKNPGREEGSSSRLQAIILYVYIQKEGGEGGGKAWSGCFY